MEIIPVNSIKSVLPTDNNDEKLMIIEVILIKNYEDNKSNHDEIGSHTLWLVQSNRAEIYICNYYKLPEKMHYDSNRTTMDDSLKIFSEKNRILSYGYRNGTLIDKRVFINGESEEKENLSIEVTMTAPPPLDAD
ncbi:hypothetical protein [Pedobacter metabolipauper]|uniref:Uncharacterized protein n=1 Tax=Pedobacter metabolipauper TaxID=425513 RepID=A0A4R6STJ0_9SPHI|nr:hypothetical protein [Pedobacter metabolipauper]TDQ08070.1 hypothetical protein ATK78_2571 [Pedobacter metabolipauper]